MHAHSLHTYGNFCTWSVLRYDGVIHLQWRPNLTMDHHMGALHHMG